MKPTAWYDPTNGMVSTDKDSPLFTPLGQVWPLCPQRPWVGLTDEEILLISADCAASHQHMDIQFARAIEARLKEKNNG